MQRVRIGLTGLAVVFLLVLLAAAVLSVVGTPPEDNAAMSNNAAEADADPKEPLAELGVAPGNAPPEEPAPAHPH